jgi:hypothetical protein
MTPSEWIGILGVLFSSYDRLRPIFAKKFYSVFPATKHAHFKDLRSRLRQMPFIYKPLGDKHFGEDLLSDYVQMRMRPIELSTLQPISGDYYDSGGSDYDEFSRFDLEATYEMVRSNRTCLIFGHAGVGKTTFSSYSVLSVINRLIVEGFYPFNPSERPIPFIVPLKVVNEAEDYPILSYVLKSNRFLSSWGGARRLVSLCRKGKILIVLDGYDEVYGSADSESTLRTEIDAIFNGTIPTTTRNPPAKSVWDFYYYLARGKNRVWLTTRKDFYRQNRLLVESRSPLGPRVERWLETRYKGPGRTEIGYYPVGDPGIASVEILGIWKRAELARKIFDRYRKADPECDLDEDEFLRFVDSYYDDETRKLSLNPLFLTVMCYVYVQNKLGETHADGNTLRDLVSECVSLLIQELDEQRVRLPIARAGKALKDRLAFPKEKIGFLRYFASRSFYEKKLSQQKVFTEQDLIEAAMAYARFDRNNASKEIAKNPKSFIKQLIYQGVFVVADASFDTTFYDFPHRRFREILAVQYWDREETISELLSMIAEPYFAEFVLIFFATSRGFQDTLLREMLRGIDDSIRGEHLASLTPACLDNAPESYSPKKLINEWIQKMADERTLRELPIGMMNHFVPDQELVARFFFQLGESKTLGDEDSVRLYATLLAQISPQSIQQLFKQLMATQNVKISRTVCEVILKHRREFVPPLLEHLDDGEFTLLSGTALSTVPATERRWWLLVLRCLSDRRLILLKRAAETSAPDVASCIRALERREKLVGSIVFFLSTSLPDFEVERKSESYELEEIFNFGPGPFSAVGLGLKKKYPLTADLVFEQQFLNSTDPTEVEEKCTKMELSEKLRESPEKRLIVTGTMVRIMSQRL